MRDQPPIAIVVTWGKDMIQEKGGLLAFIRYFEKVMSNEDGIWLQKSRNCPKYDIAFVYINVSNQVRYKLLYTGYERGSIEVYNGDGNFWEHRSVISWPRLVLAGPFVKAPRKIHMKGFQGFRYLTEELF